MKIIAIGRNYPEHARELNNPIPSEPVIFLKPDTAILRNKECFYLPDFSSDIHYEAEIVLRIAKEGKHIAEKFAPSYISAVTIGIDFTARDLQKQLKEKGLPWELSKAFDHSAPVGEFIEINQEHDLLAIPFQLLINGIIVQSANTNEMLFSFQKIISFVSARITLKQGDLIFTGTPAGVGRVYAGDILEGYVRDKKLMHITIA